jgi:Zn-dependent protease with chaperone function
MTNAYFFDGHSARLHEVELAASGGALLLRGAVERSYPLAGVHLAEPFAGAPAVLYLPDGARCEVNDPAAHDWLADTLGYRKPRVVRWQEHTGAALACLALLVLLIGATVKWGIPAASERIAASLPVEVDQSLGANTLALMEKQGMIKPSRFSDERLARLEAIKQSIAPPGMKLRLLVRDSPQFGPNALALPDGTIILTDQMVRMIIGEEDLDDYASDALAGILAHEAGHVRLRHSARALTRASLTAALSATLFGDFSAVAAGAPALLMNMKFSRAMETDADSFAIETLRARGISLAPMAEVFAKLGEREPEDSWIAIPAGYVSTHPASGARAARLQKAADET